MASLELCPCDSGKPFKDCHGQSEELSESPVERGVTLGDLCEIRTNFEHADFWLIRKGSRHKVGTPTKEFMPEYIGIKVEESAKDIILPSYLFYAMQYLHSKKYFENLAKGSLNLQHIRVEDVKSIRLGNN